MMMYFVRKLKHHKLISVIMMVQFALAMILLNKSFAINTNYSVSTAQISAIYGNTSICRMQDKSDEPMLMNSTAAQSDVTQRQAELYQWLKSSDDFSFMSFQKYEIQFYDRIPNGDNFISYDDSENVWMKGFRADEDFLTEYPVAVAEGRIFESADFITQDTLPVILGSNYQNDYAVGDVIDVPSNPLQQASSLLVVGIAQSNSYIACPTRPEGALLLDDYILYPYLQPNESTDFAEYDMLIFQSIIIPVDYENASSTITEKARQLGLYEIALTNPTRKSESYANMVSSNSGFVWVTTIAVAGFALMTIVSALMYRFSLHRKEFGEFMLCGATRELLSFEFTMETAVILFISDLIAVAVCMHDGVLNESLVIAYSAIIIGAVYVLTFVALRRTDIAKLIQEGNV